MKRIGVVGILIIAFLGIADATYLTQNEKSGTPLLCDVEYLTNCNIVAESKYAHLFGIPLAEFGILFYSALFALAALEIVLYNEVLRRVLQGVTLVGLISSLYFTLVQVFLINALCIYCLVSAVLTFLAFGLALFIEPIWRRNASTASPLALSGSLPMPPPP